MKAGERNAARGRRGARGNNSGADYSVAAPDVVFVLVDHEDAEFKQSVRDACGVDPDAPDLSEARARGRFGFCLYCPETRKAYGRTLEENVTPEEFVERFITDVLPLLPAMEGEVGAHLHRNSRIGFAASPVLKQHLGAALDRRSRLLRLEAVAGWVQ